MSDLKSKLPDLSELGGMAGKLFKDVKKSVCEIADDYKAKHKKAAAPKAKAPKAAAKKKDDK
ncbi:MAG: hypothetical protein P1U36_06700 [Legionellaceae bacterium]|nr:hypothetical protein [Legionellaceae bacterium]